MAPATLRRIPTGGEIQIRNNRRIMFLHESKETNTENRWMDWEPEFFFILKLKYIKWAEQLVPENVMLVRFSGEKKRDSSKAERGALLSFLINKREREQMKPVKCHSRQSLLCKLSQFHNVEAFQAASAMLRVYCKPVTIQPVSKGMRGHGPDINLYHMALWPLRLDAFDAIPMLTSTVPQCKHSCDI